MDRIKEKKKQRNRKLKGHGSNIKGDWSPYMS